LLRLHPASRNFKEFVRQLSIELLLKQGVRSGGVTIRGFQNEMMDFPQGIRESGPLFMFALVTHRHSEVTIGQSKPRHLGQAGLGSLWKVKR
jgi:hypothetical protein